MITFTNSAKIAELQKELNAKISLRNKMQEYTLCKWFNDDMSKVETEIKVIKSEIVSLEHEINRLVSENRVVDTETQIHKQFYLYDKDMD